MMINKIFVNLPVKNLNKSKAFFTALGFTFNTKFEDETATCMVISESIFAMLLTEEKFKQFTKKPIADAKQQTQVLIALNAESPEAVKDMVDKALAAGGAIYMEAQDHGWMYQHSFEDLDGHQWEVFYMDENAMPQ